MSNGGGISPWGPPGSVPAGPPLARPSLGGWMPPSLPAPNLGRWMPPSLPAPIGVPLGVSSPQPELSFDQSPEPSRRGRFAVGGIIVGVLALGAAGVFAVGQLRSNSGGAASPEAVGTEFMAAMEQEDALGMIDLLLPGERDVFREPMIDIVSELSRLDVLSGDATLAELSGLDIEMTNESTEVEPTNAADISNITMSATLTTSLDGDRMPIGDVISDLAGGEFTPSDLDQPAVTNNFSLPMTVVEDDGRWYLSVFHTAAETVRGRRGEPIPEIGLTPRGGTSPEGAIDAVLAGVEQLDAGKIIAAINPNEAAAMQRYAPLYLDDIDELVREAALEWQVTRSEYDVAGSGSKRFVTITALRIDGTANGSAFSIEFDDGCFVIDAEGERVDTCDLEAVEDDTPETLDDFFDGSLEITELTSAFGEAFDDYEQPGITVQEVDGQWFVSPLGSGFDQILALLRALELDDIDLLLDASTTFVGDVAPELNDLPFPDEFTIEDGTSDVFETPTESDGEVDGSLPNDFEAEQEAADGCYELDTVEDVTACLVEGIDAGVLSDYYVGVELQFPECGLAESSLGRPPLFTMSDEDYTSMIATSATCFEALIESGDLDRTAVPSEYLNPECGEGRNPWSFDVDDDEFFDRWVDCVYS